MTGEPVRWSILNPVPAADLIGGDQVGHRLHEQALDRPLEMARLILQIESFLQQELFTVVRYREHESPIARGVDNPLLHCVQLDIQDTAQLALAERLENYDLVQPVDELRSEPPARRLDSAAG